MPLLVAAVPAVLCDFHTVKLPNSEMRTGRFLAATGAAALLYTSECNFPLLLLNKHFHPILLGVGSKKLISPRANFLLEYKVEKSAK